MGANQRIGKQEFQGFCRSFFKEPTETEFADVFLFIGRKLVAPAKDSGRDSASKLSGKKSKFDQVSQGSGLAAQITREDLNSFKLDLQIMDASYDKWLKEEESLSGVLNVKVIK